MSSWPPSSTMMFAYCAPHVALPAVLSTMPSFTTSDVANLAPKLVCPVFDMTSLPLPILWTFIITEPENVIPVFVTVSPSGTSTSSMPALAEVLFNVVFTRDMLSKFTAWLEYTLGHPILIVCDPAARVNVLEYDLLDVPPVRVFPVNAAPSKLT